MTRHRLRRGHAVEKKELVPGALIEVRDPFSHISYGGGPGGSGVYKVIKAGRVNVRTETDVRFAPDGPWYHQEHTIPLKHVVRVVTVGSR